MQLLVPSPVGDLGVLLDSDVVVGVRFGASDGVAADHAVVRELDEYFAGTRTAFTVDARLVGGTEFDRAVWAQIAAIDYGETLTYGEIARAVGEPGAARAVGTACNRNPVPVLVPCHRVVGADRKLVGFGGGLDRKRRLLELEARVSLERAWR